MKSRTSLGFGLVLAFMAGCRCRPGVVEPVELGLRVEPREVDFGRVLEGTTKQAAVVLTATSRVSISVQLSTDAPFQVANSAEVPGGGDARVEVSFSAGATPVNGVLRLTVGDKMAEVQLRGVGVRPPECRPSAECVVSVYSLEEDRCVESQAEEDAPCDPGSACLEQGRCRSGRCLGIARRCDDNDKCTDDACAAGVGCVRTPHRCPTPAGLCKVATCHPVNGCGEGPAPDLSACGQQSCVEGNFCFAGVCRTVPTPEGTPCSPAVACLPEGVCRNRMCSQPTTASWTPNWSARLEGEPEGELASSGSLLYFSECVDGGPAQGRDAGGVDGGDGGGVDGGGVDGGLADGGRPLVCGLASFTGTGFVRFVYPYEDDAPRSVLGFNQQGVLLKRDGGLELRSPSTGSLRHALAWEPNRSQLVIEDQRIFFFADGGLHSWLVDGGRVLLADLAEPSALGRGSALFAWNQDAGVLTRFELLVDGGTELRELALGSVSTSQLAVADDFAILGSAGAAQLGAGSDGGLVAFNWLGADASQFLDEQTLSSSLATNIFYLSCDGGCGAGVGQETRVRVFDPSSGEPRWDGVVLGRATPGAMLATVLLEGSTGAFIALLRVETAGGPRSELVLFADGARKATCTLPDASGSVELAHFSASALVVTVRGPDGRVRLESYELGSIPLARSAWATPQGLNGTRSDRP